MAVVRLHAAVLFQKALTWNDRSGESLFEAIMMELRFKTTPMSCSSYTSLPVVADRTDPIQKLLYHVMQFEHYQISFRERPAISCVQAGRIPFAKRR